jgi:hypothetical protein
MRSVEPQQVVLNTVNALPIADHLMLGIGEGFRRPSYKPLWRNGKNGGARLQART